MNELYSGKDVSLNSKFVNDKIDYKILSDKEMTEIGFRKVNISNKQKYYYCKTLDKDSFTSISFNVTLPIPYNKDELDISVLDEAFGQPYDFQAILNRNPNFDYAKSIAEKVEKQMEYLNKSGVLYGHKKGEYI